MSGRLLVVLVVLVAAALRLLWLDSIPYGLLYDEAIVGVMAKEVYLGLDRPLWFSAYLGIEPLYVYLAAGAMAIFGPDQSVLALRATSAVVGVATVAATYAMGRELYGRRVGWLATAFIALSFFHIMHSRLGQRTITLPLLEALAVYLLFRAARRGDYRAWALGGAALGGVVYTYLASRAFPLVFVLFGVWWLLFRRTADRRQVVGCVVAVAAAAIVVAPLAAHFVGHPQELFARTSQVLLTAPGVLPLGTDDPSQEGLLVLLGRNSLKVLGTFTIYGESLTRYNLSGRPVFVWLTAVACYVGLAVLARRLWPFQGKGDAASAFVACWLVVMLLPAFLAHDVGGNSLRIMGELPAIYLLPALGLDAAYRWLGRAMERRGQLPPLRRLAAPSLVVVVLLVEGGLTFRDYFFVWPRDFATAIETGYDLVVQARFLEAHADAETTLLASSADYHLPVLAQLAPRAYPRLRWFDGGQSLVLPKDGDAIFSFPYTALPLDGGRYLAGQAPINEELFDGRYLLHLGYQLDAAALAAAAASLEASPDFTPLFADYGPVQLLGYRLDRRVVAGDVLALRLLWRVSQPPGRDLAFFAHLLDHRGIMVAQGDSVGFLAAEWRAGDLVVGRYDIATPPSAFGGAAGCYRVDVGVYDRASGEVLPARSGKGDLGRVKVASATPVAVPASATTLDVAFGGGIRLRGYEWRAAPASGSDLVLYWQAPEAAAPPRDYTVFVHLLDASGRLLAQDDAFPAGGAQPTSCWEPGEIVADRHRLTAVAGGDRLEVGLYLLATGERLPVAGGGDAHRVESSTVSLPLGR